MSETNKIKIAIGNSRLTKKWANKDMAFEDICKRLTTPIRTTESVEEYAKLPKGERDAIKDRGGFVAGHLKDNERKIEKVDCRSMWTPDLDHATSEFVARLRDNIKFRCVVYSTHSHTAEKPRLRIVAPFAREVTAEEYVAISRYLAADLGIDMFDECSFIPNQLMYWPTCPANGEYVYMDIGGSLLDPDEILATHPSWRDCSLLPTTSRESVLKKQTAKKQEDPLKKGGVVGAFCRAYTITATIEKFLSKIYEPSVMEGRYDYVFGEGSAGLVVYDNKFAYSHHATDPVCGKLLNAFDLVRLHLFDGSFTAMCEMALADDGVKMQIANEREYQAREDFAGGDWQKKLRYVKRGAELENSVWNAVLILENDPDFANFAFNKMAGMIEVTGPMPWNRPAYNRFWREADTCHLKAMLDIKYVQFSTRNHDVAFARVADKRAFHPIVKYLDSLPEWDGIPRVETLLVRCMQADDTPYVRAVTRKTLAAAVARAYCPGTKYDSILVLDGAQGIGKSTLFKDLVGEDYYSDTLSLTDMNDKSGAEKLQGFWIVEIGELAGMKKADVEKVKAFISTADDKYRQSYGRAVESHPRQCIIVASVNGERGYLRDITGNRRFWIVKLHQEDQKKSWDFTKDERDQIWAEAKRIWQAGEKLYLEDELLAEAEKMQHKAVEMDERQGVVESYLETLLPIGWNDMDLYARRRYLQDADDPTREKGVIPRYEVSNLEIWCECFGRNIGDLKKSDSYEIAALMLRIDGWERTKNRSVQRIYGRQRVYKRITK